MKLGAIGIDRNKWFLRKCTVDRRAELSLWPPLTGNIKYRKTRNRNFFPPLMPHKKLFIYLFIYQLFWTQACPEGMCTNGTQVPCEVPFLLNPTTRNYVGHTTGVHYPYSFPIVDFLRSTRTNPLKCCETGPTVFRPYPRRLESLTICRCHYKGSTFFSVI